MIMFLILTNENYAWLWSSLIGIIGVILGAFLGWFLNCLSNFGKLDCFITLWYEKFENYINGWPVGCKSYEEATNYRYNLSLDLNNRSGKPKIMRNIKLEFYSKGKMIYSQTPSNLNDIISTNPCYRYREIGIVNIHANTALQIDLSGGTNEIDFFTNVDSVILKYTNEKNKIKKIPIDQRNYKEFISEYRKYDNC